MSTNFLDPVYYDINDIHPDAPNKPLLKELFERENEQNERLWMFFTEMAEDPRHKRMTAEAIKPRTLRRKKAKKPKANKTRDIDNPESEEFMTGYKEFLKEEFEG
tara:strand:- start:50 stop:364 length:315 start_codon:yes stop_codon:yes gene_type:complete